MAWDPPGPERVAPGSQLLPRASQASSPEQSRPPHAHWWDPALPGVTHPCHLWAVAVMVDVPSPLWLPEADPPGQQGDAGPLLLVQHSCLFCYRFMSSDCLGCVIS